MKVVQHLGWGKTWFKLMVTKIDPIFSATNYNIATNSTTF